MGYGLDTIITFFISILAVIITIVAQIYVTSTYNKYKRVKTNNNLSGFEVARKILDKNGLNDIHIVEVKGNLTDHYDPKRKVVRLSKEIFEGTTIAANSVAAHEVGHAIQDKENYRFMKIRASLVPIVNFCSKIGYVVLIIGFIASALNIIYTGIFLLASMLVFQLITLPVEFDASKKANIELKNEGILNSNEQIMSVSMLRAAALTYVASLVTTFLQILRLVLIASDRD